MGKIANTLCALVAGITFGLGSASCKDDSREKIKPLEGSGKVYSLSIDDVKEDLRQLAIDNMPEDSGFYDNIRNVFVDYGEMVDHCHVKMDVDFIKDYLTEHPDLKIIMTYHNHPNRGLFYEPASTNDFVAQLGIRKKLKEFNVEIIGNAVERKGIWSYDVWSDSFMTNDKIFSQMRSAAKRLILGRISIPTYIELMETYGVNIKFEEFEE